MKNEKTTEEPNTADPHAKLVKPVGLLHLNVKLGTAHPLLSPLSAFLQEEFFLVFHTKRECT